MFNFLNSKAKVKLVSDKNGIQKYNIIFPMKNGNYIPYAADIFKIILKESDIFVHIDTSFSFAGYEEAKEISLTVRKLLQDNEIQFKHMVAPDTSNRGAVLGLIKLNKEKATCNIITFKLSKEFDNETLINKLVELGCNIYVPLKDTNEDEMLEKLFLNQFEGDNGKSSYFKYHTFLTNYITQSAITTKFLTQQEIESIFIN